MFRWKSIFSSLRAFRWVRPDVPKGVSDHKFELVAQPVVLGDLIGWLGGVG